MGLAENPFGWMWVNGAEGRKGSIALALFPRHLLHHKEQNNRTVPSMMLGVELLLRKFSRVFPSLSRHHLNSIKCPPLAMALFVTVCLLFARCQEGQGLERPAPSLTPTCPSILNWF